MKAIELKKVSFSYDGKSKILESVDYSVDYGEVCLLSGHSGEAVLSTDQKRRWIFIENGFSEGMTIILSLIHIYGYCKDT